MRSFYKATRKKDGMAADVIITGGRFLGRGPQDIYERSTVQKYDIATRLMMDERAFRYCKSVGDIVSLEYPVINSHIIPDDGFEGGSPDTPKVGDATLRIADSGAAGARPVNYYAGGFMHMICTLTPNRQTRRVLASTVGDGVGPITLTLDAPLTGVDPIGMTAIDVYPSIYSEINIPKSVTSPGEETFVGFAAALLQDGEFGWVQTWGPVNGHYCAKFPGERGAPGDRDCYFNKEGEIITPKSGSGSDAYVSLQRAGYVLPVTASSYGSVFIMLQLTP